MGPDHADVAIGLVDRANDSEREGRPADAGPLFRRATGRHRKRDTQEHILSIFDMQQYIVLSEDDSFDTLKHIIYGF